MTTTDAYAIGDKFICGFCGEIATVEHVSATGSPSHQCLEINAHDVAIIGDLPTGTEAWCQRCGMTFFSTENIDDADLEHYECAARDDA